MKKCWLREKPLKLVLHLLQITQTRTLERSEWQLCVHELHGLSLRAVESVCVSSFPKGLTRVAKASEPLPIDTTLSEVYN